MKRKSFALGFALTLFITTVLSASPNGELLKKQDINKIMNQILAEHLDEKQISAKIAKNALKIYIDQFDPDKIYLLEEEVKPYFEMSDIQVGDLINQFKQNDFSVFEKLDHVFQKAIKRMQTFRNELAANKIELFQAVLNNQIKVAPAEQNKVFASNPEELKERLKALLISFIGAERKHYGDGYVNRNQDAILKTFDQHVRTKESLYSFQDAQNRTMPESEQENLFTLHVLKALSSSLDAHTEFMSPSEAKDMRIHLQKAFQGIGVDLKKTADGIVVSGLLAGGPAAKSGQIKVNDVLVEIDGKNIANQPIDEVVEQLQGEINTSVNLVLKRFTEDGRHTLERQFSVNLKRESIVINDDRVSYTSESFGNGIIGKIVLNSFYQGGGVTSEDDVRDAIKELQKKGNLRGLILDLRENTGGFLSQAVKVAGLFMSNGIVVISKYSNGEEHFFRDMDSSVTYSGPLVILTSKLTASAAEIVAQALQDYGVAVIVGDEHTYGKGTIQTQTVTQNNSSSFFKVTIGKYYTVSGKTPQIQGVKSDVIVPGKYSLEKIGEQYIEATLVQPDQIAPAFEDPLQDVDPAMRAWYLRYYIPTEQRKIDYWKTVVPVLKKNSQFRISRDANYQRFLKSLAEKDDPSDDSEAGISQSIQQGDLQLAETLNVLKDMIYLHSNIRGEADSTANIQEKENK